MGAKIVKRKKINNMMRKYQTPETKILQVNGQDLLVSFGITDASSGPAPSAPSNMGLSDLDKTTGTW